MPVAMYAPVLLVSFTLHCKFILLVWFVLFGGECVPDIVGVCVVAPDVIEAEKPALWLVIDQLYV